MPRLLYNIGHEGAPVIERNAFEGSIFKEQYEKALKLTDSYLRHPVDETMQVVAFCGDRGDGKTSCLLSVMDIIRSLQTRERSEASDFVERLGLKKILETSFEILDLVEPSFFDSERNILELIMGRLYSNARKYYEENAVAVDKSLMDKVNEGFARIKECLFLLHRDAKEAFSDYRNLETLSYAIDMRGMVADTIRDYLKLMGKDVLLLPVDDVDLNMDQAYRMCEQLRKYISVKECVVYLAIKFDQLENAVAAGMQRSAADKGGDFFQSDEYLSMAKKYLSKLLPSAERIIMPRVYDICDYELVVMDGGNNVGAPRRLKSAIVRLIFQRTRYLFYNSKGGVSQIVPDNLRELMSLLGLLYNMPEINDKTGEQGRLIRNKKDFKAYFFNTWTKCLKEENRRTVMTWIKETPDINLNKSVVGWIRQNMEERVKERIFIPDMESEEDAGFPQHLVTAITDPENFSFNVTAGDLFYLLSLIESDRLDPEMERMLFFIKSYYSIRTYETYDLGEMADDTDLKESSIYRADNRLEGTTDLQRLTGGSYFTYPPSTFLGHGKASEGGYMDTKVIKGHTGHKGFLRGLVEDCRDIVAGYDTLAKKAASIDDEKKRQDILQELNIWEKRFRLAEFFIFTVTRAIGNKQIQNFYKGEDNFRKSSVPATFRAFNPESGYYVFDFLAPFANLVNPRFAYDRFRKLCPDMYEFAFRHEFSLLGEMLRAMAKKHGFGKEGIPLTDMERSECLRTLKSDVTIRNAEVLSAIFENAKEGRETLHGGGISKIVDLYRLICDSKMSTHPVEGNEEGYSIEFEFLRVLADYLQTEVNDVDKKSDIYLTFFSIFNKVEEDIEEQDKGNAQGGKAKSASSVNLKSAAYILLKNQQIVNLKEMLGMKDGDALTAGEIHERIRGINPVLCNYSDKDLADIYLPFKGGNKKGTYTIGAIADEVLSTSDRAMLWKDLHKKYEQNRVIEPPF